MNIWTIIDATGALHGPFSWLINVEAYLTKVKPPEPLILAQVWNGAQGTAGEIICSALQAGIEAIQKQKATDG